MAKNNLFGPVNKNNIKVGWIDIDDGYVYGYSICEANTKARDDPGTVFIFKDGNQVIRYLNINEVNKLTPEDTLSSGGECGGINTKTDCGPVRIQIYGGGGIGAVGNAIIGTDGTILAVDVVKGGNGYQYAPQVSARDDCDKGSGATFIVKIGETVDQWQYYDQFDDYEETEICDDWIFSSGRMWGPNGEDFGEWVPNILDRPGADPIKIEAIKYQKIVRDIDRAPWFNTRKNRPDIITSNDHNVIPSYNKVNDACFKAHHRYVGPDGSLENSIIRWYRERWGRTASKKEISYWIETGKSRRDIERGILGRKARIAGYIPGSSETITLLDGGWGDWMNTYAISPVPMSEAPGTDHAGIWFTFEWMVDFPVTGNYKIKGACDNRAKMYIDNKYVYTLGVYTGVQLEPPLNKQIVKGQHRVKIELYNIPIKKKVLRIKGGSSDSPSQQTNQERGSIFNTVEWIGKANRQLWRTNVYGRGGFLNSAGVCPFDTTVSLPNNPYAGTHRIEWTNVKFPADGHYNIRIAVDDNVDLYIGDQVKIFKKGFVGDSNTSTGEYNKGHFITKGTYTLIADLYQKPGGSYGFGSGSGGGSGSNADIGYNGLNSTNKPIKVTNGGKKIKLKDGSGNDTNATFKIISGNGTFSSNGRKIEGSGTITLELSWDDKANTAGRAVQSINVGGRTWSVSPKTRGSQTHTITLKGGGGIKGINPMALAIDIQTPELEEVEVVVPKPWCQNPMGIALAIDAPQPPIPQEIPPPQEGRCPPNPIWSTRFPNALNQWYPVSGKGHQGARNSPDDPNVWSPFMNRYALSPVKPLDTEGTDLSGITYSNTWTLDIAYDGYYAVKGTVDNKGRVLIDGKFVCDLQGFKTVNPTPHKVLLRKGAHSITVEVLNKPVKRSFTIIQNIFRTLDWQARVPGAYGQGYEYPAPTEPAPPVIESAPVVTNNTVSIHYSKLNKSNNTIKVTSGGKRIELKDGKGNDSNVTFTIQSGNAKFSSDGRSIVGTGKVKILLDYDDNPNYAGEAVRSIKILSVIWTKEKKHHGKETKTVDIGKGAGAPSPSAPPPETKKLINPVNVTKNGVTYSGPELFHHHETGAIDPKDAAEYTIMEAKQRDSFNKNSTPTRWAGFMQVHSVSPAFPDLTIDNPNIEGVKKYVWSNVDFPENGTYTFKFAADNAGSVFVDDQLITGSLSHETGNEVTISEHWVNTRIPKGKHTIRVEVLNIPTTEGISKVGEQSFINNPTGFALVVRYARVVQRTDRTSWKMNPMAGSAILIAPPCPKKISGKGVVTDIIPITPGVYIPEPPLPGEGYYTESTISEVIVTGRNPINYDCTKDKIIIEDNDGNDHGTVLEPICGPFGKLTGVKVVKRGNPWTSWPNIRIDSDTGNGATFLPIFTSEIVDPGFPTVEIEDLIQVTDLAGLKKTGYYDGRAYYGAVFYEDGIRYAGYYKTTGQKVQIYDTMQESIDGQVTTRPSAIQRFGTDITNNDSRLDIPGTPDTLT